jgi:hypothetical protein
MGTFPAGWTLAASSFNWTLDIVRARRSAQDITAAIPSAVGVHVIELEAGQVFRSFPAPVSDEVSALRNALRAGGGRVSIVGASIDDYRSATQRRTDEERLAFLEPQLRAAAAVGAYGVRLPVGQAGRPLLEQLVPVLHKLHLTVYEEIQGPQPLDHPAIADIRELDDPHMRLLVDISTIMPALPTTYLALLRAGGIPAPLVDRLTEDWPALGTHDAVLEVLRSGGVPGPLHMLFMNLLIRFGRTRVEKLREVIDVVGAFHLKFWDLDDADERVSAPIRELGQLLADSDFRGSLTSEWGGHEWLTDEDPTAMTRAHLTIARGALAEAAAGLDTARG